MAGKKWSQKHLEGWFIKKNRARSMRGEKEIEKKLKMRGAD